MLENTLSAWALVAGGTASLTKRSEIEGSKADIVPLEEGLRMALVTASTGVEFDTQITAELHQVKSDQLIGRSQQH